MQFFRQTWLYIASLMLITTLLFFGLLFGIERVLGTSASIKQALRESNSYHTVIGDALDQAKKQQASMDNIPVDRPEIRAIITNAFPPEFLQTQTEQALDSVYAWLHGTTPELTFKFNLGEAKMKLADGLGNYASQQVAGLPACAKGQMPNSGDFDAFAATCKPPGFDANAVAAQVKQEILSGEFIKDTEITAANLRTENGERVDQAYSDAPRAFQNIRISIYGLIVLAVLVGVGVVFLHHTRRGGLRLVGFIVAGIGAVLVLLGWLLAILMRRVAHEFAASPQGSEPLQQNGMEIMQILTNNVHNWWMGVGAVLLVLGVGGLVALHFLQPKDGESATMPPKNPSPQAEQKNGQAATTPKKTHSKNPQKHPSAKRK